MLSLRCSGLGLRLAQRHRVADWRLGIDTVVVRRADVRLRTADAKLVGVARSICPPFSTPVFVVASLLLPQTVVFRLKQAVCLLRHPLENVFFSFFFLVGGSVMVFSIFGKVLEETILAMDLHLKT